MPSFERFCTIARALVASALLLPAGATARADAIAPWSGGGAGVRVFDPAHPYDNQVAMATGPTASASDSKTVDVTYHNASSGAGPFHVPAYGSASAGATGRADGLLQLSAWYSARNPGTLPWVDSPSSLGVGARAEWNGDRAMIQAPSGGAAPSTIRLNFTASLDASSSHNSEYSDPTGITFTANGLSARIDGSGPAYRATFQARAGTLALDSTTTQPPGILGYQQGGPNTASFHLDLPVNASGLSDPFSLSLEGTTSWGLYSNADIFSRLKDASLSLTSITTTDGTLLSDLGDTVTFTSGLIAPSPVPEPSTVALLGILGAGLVGRKAVRRKAA